MPVASWLLRQKSRLDVRGHGRTDWIWVQLKCHLVAFINGNKKGRARRRQAPTQQEASQAGEGRLPSYKLSSEVELAKDRGW